jgi:anti-anti-sigma regulatory factor
MPFLKLNIRRYHNELKPTVLKMSGAAFDSETVRLSEFCAVVIRSSYREVVFDLSELDYIGLRAVRLLIWTIRSMEQAGTIAKIRGMSEDLKTFLRRLGAYKLLSPELHEDSWRRLEYLPEKERGLKLNVAANAGGPALAMTV